MNIHRLTRRVRRFVRKQWLRTQPRGVILVYHRVISVDADPQRLCVSPEHFSEQLDVLRQDYRPLGLQEMARGLGQAPFPHRTVVVTFDDGFADNLHHAKPLLERCRIPATVYVTAGAVDRLEEFYWDDLERILLRPGTLPAHLSLMVSGTVREWDLGDAATYTEAECLSHRGWNVSDPESPTGRHELYRKMCALFRPLAEGVRKQLARDIAKWAGVGEAGRKENLALSREELRRLASGGLVEIGAHTMTHPSLSALSAEDQRAEILQSKERLESLLGKPVTSFAYPFGTRKDYTRETVEQVRSAGFACACSNFEGVVWRGADRFQLPRFLVRDWTGDEFARRLQKWING